MQFTSYLLFDGQCREAFKLYEQCFGGKIAMMMTHGESPMGEQVAPEWRDKVMHIRLEVGNQALMGSDAPPGHFERPQGFSVSIAINDAAEAERIFNALAEGGTVNMPFQQTFWAQGFGMLVDRFGIPWMVNCEKAAS